MHYTYLYKQLWYYDLLLYFYIIDIINAYIELMDNQTEYSRASTLEELVDVARVYIVI